MTAAPHFQVMLGGSFKNYQGEEDKLLKRAFMSGFMNAKYKYRGQEYEYNFKDMMQKNLATGKNRQIRPPHKWAAPSAPVVPPGRTATVKVRKGQPGTTINLKHPDGGTYPVSVPASAKQGQTMLVPIPSHGVEKVAATDAKKEEKSGWSTGAKVAAGTAGAAVVAGGAVAGVLIAEHGVDGAGEIIVDAGEDAGEAIAGAAEDVGDWVGEAAEDVGDFFMDLF